MREIKFKLWNNRKKDMQGTKITNYFSLRCDGKVNYSSNMLKDGDMILLQFTGLKDKNGTEIYEGDVLQWIYLNGGAPYKQTGEVEYVHNAFCIRGTHILNSFDSISSTDDDEGIKVIGNIYENPELLTSKHIGKNNG